MFFGMRSLIVSTSQLSEPFQGLEDISSICWMRVLVRLPKWPAREKALPVAMSRHKVWSEVTSPAGLSFTRSLRKSEAEVDSRMVRSKFQHRFS